MRLPNASTPLHLPPLSPNRIPALHLTVSDDQGGFGSLRIDGRSLGEDEERDLRGGAALPTPDVDEL